MRWWLNVYNRTTYPFGYFSRWRIVACLVSMGWMHKGYALVWIVLISITFSMKYSKDNDYRKIWTTSTICHTYRERDVCFKSCTTSRWSLSFVSCIVTQSNKSLWPFVPSLTPPKDEAIYGTFHRPCEYILYMFTWIYSCNALL